MDYKDTLFLPKTDFPMKAKLQENEEKTYKTWGEIINLMQEVNKTSEHFTLHDGPPYANGHLHIGHALNKILKDIVVKYHHFNGKKVFYTPGWDCHGLPIEQQVELKLNGDKISNIREQKDSKSILHIRSLCREHANSFIDIQKEEFLKLGVIGDFNNPYKTLKFEFEADIYKALCQVAKKGLLLQRSKPIFWSWAARSALADAEVEYKNKKSDSVYVRFDLNEESKQKILDIFKVSNKLDEIYMIIWTTTPWTLPSNVAIALNADEEYALLEDGSIVASKLVANLKKLGVVSKEIISTTLGKNLEFLKAINPLNDRESLLVLGSHVSMSDGTGSVHTAPGHGEDDYNLALKYNLDIIMVVDDSGHFDAGLKELKLLKDANSFVGMHIFKAQKQILELLGSYLLRHEEITHSYPHCWRTNKPVIFRATKQWFIALDKPYLNGKTLREVALEQISKTRFYPHNGAKRIASMVANRPDWCISRQRDWGVPLAFLIDKVSKKPLLDEEVLEFIANIFTKEGCDAWWDKSIEELLPPTHISLASSLEKSSHILDVWFDSGSTWKAVLNSKQYNAGDFPASMYLEGSDQHRGWFQSSLLLSCAINGFAPFKSVLTHGFVGDEKGEKMSKSKGNVVSPLNVISEYGSEILRLWVGSIDYQNDVKISKAILKQNSDFYLKIRNTIRFLLANINGLKSITLENLDEIDKWILAECFKVINEAWNLFGEYELSKGMGAISNFIAVNLSGIYLDICKDSLYCDGLDSKARIAKQSVMAVILENLLFVLAPILTYTTNEALGYAKDILKVDSIFKLKRKEHIDISSSINFTFLIALRARFNEAVDKLKKQKEIKSSLELGIAFKENLKQILAPKSNISLEELKDLISRWLMVSLACLKEENKQEVKEEIKVEEANLSIFISPLFKCPRCWQFNAPKDGLCPRCSSVLK